MNEKQEDRKKLRNKLHDFFEELKKYMSDNHLEDDILLKNLCDDIYICYRTFGTSYGFMYCNARECSQGQQRAYTATQLPDDTDQHIFTRQNAIYLGNAIHRSNGVNYDDYEDNMQPYEDNMQPDELQHNVSGATQTPYRTQTMTGVMRSCSAGTNVEEFEDEEQTQKM